jgi:hypothetical protein
MNQIVTVSTNPPILLPEARVGITIRPGTMDDIAFIDRLQKKQSKEVGFFPTMAIEGKIRLGHVLVAEATETADRSQETGEMRSASSPDSSPVGYLIGNDQYFKRDDVGCIFQINVAAEYRRSLVAASLLKAQFERSSYGCRLYCCWCAQDIAANRFWESMGFVPLAFRTGSHAKDRVHIFWQKRIREGDTGDVSRGGTAWWFPFKTNGGVMRADRIVLPIPPGMRWDDELPRLVAEPTATPMLVGDAPPKKKSKSTTKLEAIRNGVRFCIPLPKNATTHVREKKPKPLANPKIAAAARELRDKFLEQVHAGAVIIEPAGKYALERSAPAAMLALPEPIPMLAA